MQAHWINSAPYYRCRFPQEYALANKITHPRNVYLREDVIVPRLDRWLAELFAPEHIGQTIQALMATHDAPRPDAALAELARRRIADCDRKLSQHRAALEAGADPATIAAWMKEELARKAEAERQLQRMPAASASPGPEELVAALRSLGDMAEVLGRAKPERKAKIYAGLGIRLAFHPDQGDYGRVRVSAADSESRIGGRFVSEGACGTGRLYPRHSRKSLDRPPWSRHVPPSPGAGRYLALRARRAGQLHYDAGRPCQSRRFLSGTFQAERSPGTNVRFGTPRCRSCLLPETPASASGAERPCS